MKEEFDNEDCLVKSEVGVNDSEKEQGDDDIEMIVTNESTTFAAHTFNVTKNPQTQLKGRRGINTLSHYARTIILKDLKENGVNKVESEGIKGKFKCELNEVEGNLTKSSNRVAKILLIHLLYFRLCKLSCKTESIKCTF